MKVFTTNILIIVIIGLHSCSPKLQTMEQYAAVEFLYKEEIGTISIKSSGYGSKIESAIENAQLNAFKIILFKGLPGSDLNVPLVEKEIEAKSKHRAYFEKLLEQGEYKKYIMSSTFNSEPQKAKDGIWVSLEIKINYNSLRKDLEQFQIIRKLGF